VNYDRTALTGNSQNRATANRSRTVGNRQEAIAARFLAELAAEQQAENVWVEDVRTKIDAAISASEQTPPIDGETFVNKTVERFQRDRVLTDTNIQASLCITLLLVERDSGDRKPRSTPKHDVKIYA
jgi:hypothetical protein